MEIIEILLAFGANPSVRDVRGNTCLHMATAIRSAECLKLLAESVNSKDELNAINNFGKFPLLLVHQLTKNHYMAFANCILLKSSSVQLMNYKF